MKLAEVIERWQTITSLEEAEELFDTVYPPEDINLPNPDENFSICRLCGSNIKEDDLDEVIELYLDRGMHIHLPILKFTSEELVYYYLLFVKT